MSKPTAPDSSTAKLEVVQREGWLLKRGEGFDEEAVTRQRGGSSVVFDRLLKGSEVEKLLKGSSERKRYFKLISIVDRGDDGRSPSLMHTSVRDKSLSNSAGRAELRYFKKPDDKETMGVVIISNDCQLITSPTDSTLKLITPGRTYTLRPEGDAMSANAKTDAAQWADALKREIRTQRAMPGSRRELLSPGTPMAETPGGGRNLAGMRTAPSMRIMRGDSIMGEMAVEERELPTSLEEILADKEFRGNFYDFLETALASENLAFVDALDALEAPGGNTPQAVAKIMADFVVAGSPREVNISSAQRTALTKLKAPKPADFAEAKSTILSLIETNFLKRYLRDAMEKTGAFAALYATLGLDGWHVVLEHFGPVKTDLERCEAAFKSRLKQAEVQIEIIRKELESASREVAETKQPMFGAVLNRTYRLSVVRLERLVFYSEELKDQVLAPLAELARKLQSDLNLIVKQASRNIQLMDEARTLLSAVKTDFDGARAKGVPTEALKKQLIECESAFEHAEVVNAKPMEAAMAKLESLELYRIEEQSRIIRHALLAENMMHADVKRAIAELDALIKAIDVDSEVQQLADEVDFELAQ